VNRYLHSVLLVRRSPMARLLRDRIAASLVSIPGAIAMLSTIPAVSAGVGMTVSGQISNKSGEPQQGYVVMYTCHRSAKDETKVGSGISEATGADGKFEILNVPAGECMFSAFPQHGTLKGGRVNPCWAGEDLCGGPTTVTLTIRPGANVHDLLLKSPVPVPPQVPVSVRVVDEAGEVLSGYAVIALFGSSDCEAPGARCFVRRLWTKPDGTSDGSLPAGFCRLWACQLNASNECPDDWVGHQEGPCVAGEPCASITLTAPGPVDVTLRRGTAQP
jgi:hypothetical protein